MEEGLFSIPWPFSLVYQPQNKDDTGAAAFARGLSSTESSSPPAASPRLRPRSGRRTNRVRTGSSSSSGSSVERKPREENPEDASTVSAQQRGRKRFGSPAPHSGSLRRQTVSCEGDFPRSLTAELREAFYATVLSGPKKGPAGAAAGSRPLTRAAAGAAIDAEDEMYPAEMFYGSSPPRSGYAANTSYYYDSNNNMRRGPGKDRPATVVIGSDSGPASGSAGLLLGLSLDRSDSGVGSSRFGNLKAGGPHGLSDVPHPLPHPIVATSLGRAHSCDPLPSKGVAVTLPPSGPLRAVETAVDNTPLSSLRSCSEFTKFSISKFDARHSTNRSIQGQNLLAPELASSVSGSDVSSATKTKRRGIKRWISSTFGLGWYSHEQPDSSATGTGVAPAPPAAGVAPESAAPVPATAVGAEPAVPTVTSTGSRRVTFRDGDSFDEQSELSYLVDSLSRSTSRSMSQSARTYSSASANAFSVNAGSSSGGVAVPKAGVAASIRLLGEPRPTAHGSSNSGTSHTPNEASKVASIPLSPAQVQIAAVNDIDTGDAGAAQQLAHFSQLAFGSTQAVDFKQNSPHRSSLLLMGLNADSRWESAAARDGAAPMEMELREMDFSAYHASARSNSQGQGRPSSRHRSRTHFNSSRTFYDNYYNKGKGLFTGTSNNYADFQRTITQDSATTGTTGTGANSNDSLVDYFRNGGAVEHGSSGSGNEWTTNGMFSRGQSFASRNSSYGNLTSLDLHSDDWLRSVRRGVSGASLLPDSEGVYAFHYNLYYDQNSSEDEKEVPRRAKARGSSAPAPLKTTPTPTHTHTRGDMASVNPDAGVGTSASRAQGGASPRSIASGSASGSSSPLAQSRGQRSIGSPSSSRTSPSALAASTALETVQAQLVDTFPIKHVADDASRDVSAALLRRLPRRVYRHVVRPGLYYLGYVLSFCAFCVFYCLLNPNWWRKMVFGSVQALAATLASFSRRVLFDQDGEDADFYELIRLQPFATGGYLRGMLVSGFASLAFCIFSLILWPDLKRGVEVDTDLGSVTGAVTGTGPTVSPCDVGTEGLCAPPAHLVQVAMPRVSVPSGLESCVYAWLVLQTALHVLQLLPRIMLHLSCWEVSRSIDVSDALTVLRRILASDVWAVNRLLGRITDVLVLLALVLSELFLWTWPAAHPLRPVVLGMASTSILTFIIRGAVVAAFATSNHDPAVLAEARRRGLTKWDIDVLPTVVYTDRREVTSPECSICLCDFDLGELVTTLPCDGKHSFHETCIRKWLQRQNSCPLCQKMV